MYDLTIIGASFSGLAVALKASECGLKTLVVEQKSSVSNTLRSTGILTDKSCSLLSPDLSDIYKIEKVNLFSPSLKRLELVSKNTHHFYSTNLGNLLEKMYQKCVKAGTYFAFNEGLSSSMLKDTKFLVGADGAISDTAEIFSLGKNKELLVGYEIHTKDEIPFPKDAFSCFLSNKYAKGYIGWVVPFYDNFQIGLACLKNNKININGFLKHIGIENTIEITETRSGIIPVGGILKNFSKDNIMLSGDALGLVSPLSAGGIHYSLKLGALTGEFIYKYLKENGSHPFIEIKKYFPDWRFKHFLRHSINHTPDFALNLGFYAPFFKKFAEKMFFH